jgi:hypothetical protein
MKPGDVRRDHGMRANPSPHNELVTIVEQRAEIARWV